MHPSRWGDPARAAALPDTARGLIEMVFGLDERPAQTEVSVPAPVIDPALLDELAGTLGAEHVRTDDETRRLRTRGKSTPDLLRQRTRRPERRARRRRAARQPRRRGRRPRLGGAAPRRRRPVRRRHLGDRRPGRPARRLRRTGLARPDPDEAAARGRPHLDDRDPRARPARPGGRGAARGRGAHARPLPAVLRVRHDRRLRGHPVERPVQRRLRPLRRAGGRPAGRHPERRGQPRQRPRQRRGPRPAPAVPRLRGRLRRHHRRHRAGPQGPGREGLRGLALAVLRRRRRRDAHPRPGRPAADRHPALRRVRDRDQPGPPRRDRRTVGGRLHDDHRLRGRARGGRGEAGGGHLGPLRPRWREPRRGAGSVVGQGPVRRAVPPRLPARRRGPGRDPRDRDVLERHGRVVRRR